MAGETASTGTDTARYAFGNFVLDTRSEKLCRAGEEVPLRPQSFRILVCLLQHAGELVTKPELLDVVWGDTAVTDDSLTHCITDIRKALDDDSRTLVRTVPRRGYRFEMPVRVDSGTQDDTAPQVSDAESGTREGSERRLGIFLVSLLILIGTGWIIARFWNGEDADSPKASIALLPFADLSAEQDQQYLADGVTEEILNLLAQNPELRVIARTSSFSFRGSDHDIDTVAAKLGVSHILEGSVRKSGNELRIAAQLIDVSDASHLWSEIYHRELGDLLAVQSDIAAAVAEKLEVSLLPARRTQSLSSKQSLAHERYLLGKYFHKRRNPGDMALAEQYLREATRIDPEYAPPWAALSGVYLVQSFNGEIDFQEGLALRRETAEQALALDPDLPEAHYRIASVYRHSGEWDKARIHWRKLKELAPQDALVLGASAGLAFKGGDYKMALKFQQAVVKQDPLSAISRGTYGLMLMGAGKLEAARREFLGALELKGGKDKYADLALAEIALYQGRLVEAEERLDKAPHGVGKTGTLAILREQQGMEDRARLALEELRASKDRVAMLEVAEFHAYQGRDGLALQWLERYLQTPPKYPGNECRGVFSSVFLRVLHDDVRWRELSAGICGQTVRLLEPDNAED